MAHASADAALRSPGCGILAAPLSGLLILLTLCGPAWANAGVIPVDAWKNPSNRGGAFIARPTVLVIEQEDLSFQCIDVGCEFKAVYKVYNPREAREEVVGAFYGIHSSDHPSTERFEATANGVDVRRRLLRAEQFEAIDAAVAAPSCRAPIDGRQICEEAPPWAHDGAHGGVDSREGFAFGVDAGARATLVFSGRMQAFAAENQRNVPSRESRPAALWRHPLLGTEVHTEERRSFYYAIWPIRSWASYPDIHVSVHCARPCGWAPDQNAWVVNDEENGIVARRTIAARDVSSSMLEFSLITKPGTTERILNGGPMIGLGSRLGVSEFRGRIGYEVAFPWWFLWSASAETNFRDTVTLLPMAELATPNIWIFSLGAGAGVPIQVRSGYGTLAGARAQLTLSLPILSLVLPVDVFPGALSSERWQVGLFGQASF